MKKFLFVIIGLMTWMQPVLADVELPADLPTIEALISLHKMMKAEEDKAMEKIARERFFMKADDEDIFVLSDDDREAKGVVAHETAE